MMTRFREYERLCYEFEKEPWEYPEGFDRTKDHAQICGGPARTDHIKKAQAIVNLSKEEFGILRRLAPGAFDDIRIEFGKSPDIFDSLRTAMFDFDAQIQIRLSDGEETELILMKDRVLIIGTDEGYFTQRDFFEWIENNFKNPLCFPQPQQAYFTAKGLPFPDKAFKS